jgi:hypothetical protein
MKEYDPSQSSLTNYIDASHTIARTVELISRRHVSQDVVENWKILGGAMRFADDAIDNVANSYLRRQIAGEAVAFLREPEKESLLIDNSGLQQFLPVLKQRIHGLPEDRRGYFFRNLNVLLKVTERIRNARNVGELSKLTRLEGQLTGKLYLSFLPTDFHTSYVIQGVTRFGRIANNIDTAADLGRDFNNGEVTIEPTMRNRTWLLIDSMNDGLQALQTIRPTFGFIAEAVQKTQATLSGRVRRSV